MLALPPGSIPRSLRARTRDRRLTNRARRLFLEAALERLLDAVDGLLADLDAIDGDSDLEDGNGQEAACEDEGWDSDSEPDQYHTVPSYADGGTNQTRIVGSLTATPTITGVGS